MIGYRCKCGAMWGSYSGMSPADCEGCRKCGTTLASHKNGHQPIQPHDYEAKPIPEADQPDATRTICRKCHRLKKHIEKNED